MKLISKYVSSFCLICSIVFVYILKVKFLLVKFKNSIYCQLFLIMTL